MEKLRGHCLKMNLCFYRTRSGADCGASVASWRQKKGRRAGSQSHTNPLKGGEAAEYGLITCSSLVICIYP